MGNIYAYARDMLSFSLIICTDFVETTLSGTGESENHSITVVGVIVVEVAVVVHITEVRTVVS